MDSEWRPGFPPGQYYVGMTDDFEVKFTPIGVVWHREAVRKTTMIRRSTTGTTFHYNQFSMRSPSNVYVANGLDLGFGSELPDRINIRAITGLQHFQKDRVGTIGTRYKLTEEDEAIWPGIGGLLIKTQS